MLQHTMMGNYKQSLHTQMKNSIFINALEKTHTLNYKKGLDY